MRAYVRQVGRGRTYAAEVNAAMLSRVHCCALHRFILSAKHCRIIINYTVVNYLHVIYVKFPRDSRGLRIFFVHVLSHNS